MKQTVEWELVGKVMVTHESAFLYIFIIYQIKILIIYILLISFLVFIILVITQFLNK